MSKRGHEQPHLDNASPADLFSSQSPPTPEPSPVVFKPPASVARRVETQEKVDEAEWERLDGQGIRTMAAQRRQVGGTAETAEDIERAAVGIARTAILPKRPKPRRSGFGHKADMGDADKRVEAAYGKRGES